jgi:hypothetical protein
VFLPQKDGTDAASLAVTDTPTVRKLTRDSLPQHLQDLVDRSVKFLDETQQTQTFDMLTRFAGTEMTSEELNIGSIQKEQLQSGNQLVGSQCRSAMRLKGKSKKWRSKNHLHLTISKSLGITSCFGQEERRWGEILR